MVGRANRHPHITAVVVVHERLQSDDWREEILARYQAPDRSMDAAIEDTFTALREVEAAWFWTGAHAGGSSLAGVLRGRPEQ